MIPDVVVDVGNSRIKWGLLRHGLVARQASLPADEPSAWQEQVDRWQLGKDRMFALAGVQPVRLAALRSWLQQHGQRVWTIDSHRLLPLSVAVPHPEKVGLDRLLNAVAARARKEPAQSAIIADAGTAVTVDLVDAAGVFRGGAILPGCRLMALALHQHTALLPLVEMKEVPRSVVGTSTMEAIQAGICWSVIGAIRTLVEKASAGTPTAFFLTGGDANWIGAELQALGLPVRLVPELTLSGIAVAAAHAEQGDLS